MIAPDLGRPLAASAACPDRAQNAGCLLLLRPAAFGYNEETAATNRFQHRPAASGALQNRAAAEFDRLCAALLQAGVRLCVVEDSIAPPKPDAIFPNNWVSWHHDGTVVLYPMQPVSRRAERRFEVVEMAEAHAGFARRRLIDLSAYESEGRYLEGTGSLVLDHRCAIAYACRSPRTDERLVTEWGQMLGYQPVIFDARAADGTAPYHTNVMLAIGSEWAMICSGAIVAADRDRVLASLAACGRKIIEISLSAMQRFAANVLEVRSDASKHDVRRVLAMSSSAAEALQAEGQGRWETLLSCVDERVVADIGTIEQVGGGSVRCMLAEIFVA